MPADPPNAQRWRWVQHFNRNLHPARANSESGEWGRSPRMASLCRVTARQQKVRRWGKGATTGGQRGSRGRT
eukprot:7579408-Pyramimonas_sp.AAC.1